LVKNGGFRQFFPVNPSLDARHNLGNALASTGQGTAVWEPRYVNETAICPGKRLVFLLLMRLGFIEVVSYTGKFAGHQEIAG